MKVTNNNQLQHINNLKPLFGKKASDNSIQEKSIINPSEKKMDQISFSKEARNHSNQEYRLYDKKIATSRSLVDKGTAAHTTVQVSRSAFDKIMNATTYGETKWEECGSDGNKRWVVVNGQRFEVPHSAAEKAKIKNAQKTILDYIIESKEKIKEKNKGKNNGVNKPSGNIEALKNNKEVVELLGTIFNTDTFEGILNNLK